MASAETRLTWLTNNTRNPAVHGEPLIANLHPFKTARSSCSPRDPGMPGEWNAVELHDLGTLGEHRRRISRGHRLYATGSPFVSLYFVRIGSIRTSVLLEDGREQVTGFHMLGDLIGLEGISAEIHNCAATALEDSEVCLLPFSHLEDLSSANPAIQRHLHRLMSSEVIREQHKTFMLGTMRAEEKLAWFLLDLSARYLNRGYSASEFVLRMTRAEIGSFLGLKLETVSRLFSRFQDAGLIIVQLKNVKILAPAGLRELIGQ